MIQKTELNEAITEYYMPYAMKVITDRALPDVKDGLKPIARKILWIMWNSGLKYTTSRDKCGKIVGDILKIHNHGDSSVYNALALLTEENESLTHAFIDGEGAFGKIYSKDSPSAMRYTSARLNKFSEEMFKDIDKNIIKFIGEDKKHLQPLALTNTYPNILIKPNSGLAVGEACNWCSFNLKEICDLTIAYINNKNVNLIDYLKAPDFSTGAYIITSEKELEKIYSTGKGKFRLRAKYKYIKEENTIEVYEIPYNTTVDDIIKDINELITKGKIKDISDVRDDTGYDKKQKREVMGIAIELKRGANADIVMKQLYKQTRLETSFSCNFNCLVNYKPKTLGIKEILNEWLNFRIECIKKSIKYDIDDKIKTLHFLKGLEKVLLDIDKAIHIIRHSLDEEMIIKNLSQEFSIDDLQSNNISNMKLKNINQDYIVKKIKSISDLENEILDLKKLLLSEEKINEKIIEDLQRVKLNYGIDRRSEILNENEVQEISKESLIEDYNIKYFLSEQQWIKKIPLTSLRGKGIDEQKLKDNDYIFDEIDSTNKSQILFFTDKANRYKLNSYEINDCKPTTLGEYLYNILPLEKDENVIKIISIPLESNSDKEKDNGSLILVFENGQIGRISMSKYISNNKKLTNCYNTDSKLLAIDYIPPKKETDILMCTAEGKALIINTEGIRINGSKITQGVVGIKLSDEFVDNKVIGCIINVTEDDGFTIKTEKGNELSLKLGDISPTNIKEEQRTLFKYIYGRKANAGNFIFNCRAKNDRVISLINNK